MAETYAKTQRDSVMSKLRYGKVERYEYVGRTLNNVAGEIFIEGRLNQRLYIPFNTTVFIQVFGTMRDSAGTPLGEAFIGNLQVVRPASGNAVLTGATNLLTKVDGTTAYAKLVPAIANAEELRFTYTGAAASNSNLIRFRLNVSSVCTDADVIAS